MTSFFIKKSLLAIMVSSTMVISACGGGSSDSSSKKDQKTTPSKKPSTSGDTQAEQASIEQRKADNAKTANTRTKQAKDIYLASKENYEKLVQQKDVANNQTSQDNLNKEIIREKSNVEKSEATYKQYKKLSSLATIEVLDGYWKNDCISTIEFDNDKIQSAISYMKYTKVGTEEITFQFIVTGFSDKNCQGKFNILAKEENTISQDTFLDSFNEDKDETEVIIQNYDRFYTIDQGQEETKIVQLTRISESEYNTIQ